MSNILKAFDDEWPIRVTLTDGRVFIGNGLDLVEGQPDGVTLGRAGPAIHGGFVHIRPCDSDGAGAFSWDGHRDTPGKCWILRERGVDVAVGSIASVEEATS